MQERDGFGDMTVGSTEISAPALRYCESRLFGLPVIVSELIPHGELWALVRSDNPSDLLPKVVRLRNLSGATDG